MYNLKIKILTALFTVVLIVGCGGDSSSLNIGKKPSLNESNIINSATQEVTLSETQFSDGVTIEDIKVVAETEDGTKAIEAVVFEGTEFVDDKGVEITTTPTVSVIQRESVEEVIDEGKISTKSVVQTELKIITENGKSILPSKPIDMILKAPNGANPGDEVRVDIPNNTTVTKNAGEEKLIIIIVGLDGKIHLTLIPEAFEGSVVIKIIFEKDDGIPITGGMGSN